MKKQFRLTQSGVDELQAELTTLVLIWPQLGVLLPIARVAALLWLVVAGALLPLQRNEIRNRQPVTAAR